MCDVFDLLYEEKLRYDNPAEELDSLLTLVTDPERMRNMKKKIEKELYPEGCHYAF